MAAPTLTDLFATISTIIASANLAKAQTEALISASLPVPQPVPVPVPVPTPVPVPVPVPVPPVKSGFYIGTQANFIASWSGEKIYKDNVNWATTTDPWSPTWLADLSGYGCLRHMDTNSVNWSKITSWSQRKLPTDPKNAEVYIDGSSAANTTGMAVEWQIDLCNKANVNCWLTHPYLADDDYIRQQALLAKALLKPGLKLYIELGNENWHGMFSSFQQAIDAGARLSLPGSNKWYSGIAHAMFRSLQMYAIYEEVFGKVSMGTSVIRVFAQSGNLDLTTQALANVYQSGKWNPTAQRIDLLALAPYIGNGWDGATVTFQQWKDDVDQKVAGEPIGTAKKQMTANGIPLLGCYEGGAHFLQNADKFARNSLAEQCYDYMLDQWSKNMNDVFNHYTLHGTWSSGAAWGAFDHTGQPLSDAPKARSLQKFIQTHK